MFKFNFGNENSNLEEYGSFIGESTNSINDRKDNVTNWYECKRVEIVSRITEKLKNPNEEEIVHFNYDGDITLSCLSPSHIINYLMKGPGNIMSDVLEAEKNHSDLMPGKYEGGLKVWECTRDLVNYLAANATMSFSGKKVLDMGCGAGILGIVALLKGASVTFQDYNQEVIELVTIPNVFLNMKQLDAFENKTEFFYGDWGSFLDCVLQNEMSGDKKKNPSQKKVKTTDCAEKFDFILSSETIYNSDNYVKIYELIKGLMKDEGVCYMAAKKCYFGVGGNIHSFTEYLKKNNVFNVESCWSSNEGVAREIIKITFQNYSNIGA